MRFRSLVPILYALVLPTRAAALSGDSHVVVAPDDTGVRLILPPSAAQQLSRHYNVIGEDLQVQLVHQPHDEIGTVLKSYRVVLTRLSDGKPVGAFGFVAPVVLQLGVWTLWSRNAEATHPWNPVQDLRTVLGAYWHNGREYLRVDELSVTADQTLTLTIHNAGTYQVRAVIPAPSLRLARNSPYPRIITPQGLNNRRAFFFFEGPVGEEVTGSIYDLRGFKVRLLRVNAQSPTANCLVWDGRDDNGHVVPAGGYLYKISNAHDSLSGGLVVAR